MPRTLPRYLEPTAPIAPAAVLTGDPKRAMELATAVTDRPLMSNLARGLWGYHGRTQSGAELSVHSTGIGGPSTALVVRELHGHGVRRAIRVGTATALGDAPALGSAAPVDLAWGFDGTSSVLRAGEVWRESGRRPGITSKLETEELRSDGRLLTAFAAASRTEPVDVASLDVPLELGVGGPESFRELEVDATDLSTAAFLAQAAALGVEAAAVVIITASPEGELSLADADAACLEAGRIAAEILTSA